MWTFYSVRREGKLVYFVIVFDFKCNIVEVMKNLF